jgi:hypothetical protein
MSSPNIDPYSHVGLHEKIETWTREGRPDHVLRQILHSGSMLPGSGMEDLRASLAIAATMGTPHLIDVCFTAMLEFSAGLLMRLQLVTEREMKHWDRSLEKGGEIIPPALQNDYLPALDRVHHHMMELAKAQATCHHVREIAKKKIKTTKVKGAKPKIDAQSQVLKYANATVNVGRAMTSKVAELG